MLRLLVIRINFQSGAAPHEIKFLMKVDGNR